MPDLAQWGQQWCHCLHFLPTRKGAEHHMSRLSHHKLTLSSSRAPFAGNRESYPERDSQKAPSQGNSGFQGKGRLDPTQDLRVAFRKARIMGAAHAWLRSYGEGAQEKVGTTQATNDLLRRKWMLLNKGSYSCCRTSTAQMILLSFIDLLIYLLRWGSTL